MSDYFITSDGGFEYEAIKFETASMTAEELAALLAHLLRDGSVEGTLKIPGRGTIEIRPKVVGEEPRTGRVRGEIIWCDPGFDLEGRA